MIRKFKSNNYVKGQLTARLAGEDKKIKFSSPKRNVQIVEFDTEDFDRQTLNFLYGILGISENSPYRELHLCREILDSDPEGYTRIRADKENETEKAIRIAGCWIPKSQILIKNNCLYVKDWIFEKNIECFDFSRKN